FLPTHHAERAPIFSVSGALFSNRSINRRLEGTVVSRWIWNWNRHDCASNQRRFAGWLHVRLSLAATSGWRISGPIFPRADMLSRVRVRELFQSPAHALGVAESVLGRFR